jgi:hypothetical protein
MIDEKTAINIHNILIDKFGGTKGIRDINSLNSALARPYATFDQKDLIQLKQLNLKKSILFFFDWVSPKPIHFFALMQKSKQKKSRLHFVFSSCCRNYFHLQNCDLLGDIRAELSSSQKVPAFCFIKINR